MAARALAGASAGRRLPSPPNHPPPPPLALPPERKRTPQTHGWEGERPADRTQQRTAGGTHPVAGGTRGGGGRERAAAADKARPRRPPPLHEVRVLGDTWRSTPWSPDWRCRFHASRLQLRTTSPRWLCSSSFGHTPGGGGPSVPPLPLPPRRWRTASRPPSPRVGGAGSPTGTQPPHARRGAGSCLLCGPTGSPFAKMGGGDAAREVGQRERCGARGVVPQIPLRRGGGVGGEVADTPRWGARGRGVRRADARRHCTNGPRLRADGG